MCWKCHAQPARAVQQTGSIATHQRRPDPTNGREQAGIPVAIPPQTRTGIRVARWTALLAESRQRHQPAEGCAGLRKKRAAFHCHLSFSSTSSRAIASRVSVHMTLMSPLPNGIEPKAFVLGVDQTTFRQSCAGVAGVESAAVACPWQRNSRVTPAIERVSVIILAILS
jgi:hypothetical protein